MTSTIEAPPWRPILADDARARALAVAIEIAEALRDLRDPAHRRSAPSLWDGNAGVAIFFAYLHQALPDRGYDDAATSFVDQALDDAADEPMGPSLYKGITGVAWMLDHLRGRVLPADDEDANEDVDAALLELMQSPWRDRYDLLDGLVGFGLYALTRLPRPAAAACAELVVDQLAATVERRPEGLTWRTGPQLMIPELRARFPDGNFTVGPAHGVAGVIAFLAAAGAAGVAGVAAGRARELLDGAVAWLLSCRLPDAARGQFPRQLSPTGGDVEPARAAWCAGDPGVASALWVAAREVGEPAWERHALAIARDVLRRPPEASGVVDATLCHGTAGLAHMWNRFYQATGEPAFADAARFWITRTLDMRRSGEGVAGFALKTPAGREARPGLLQGAAGIGLALLAAATAIAPAWDSALLLSPWHGRA
jgi:lantibiotic modifying enzyme